MRKYHGSDDLPIGQLLALESLTRVRASFVVGGKILAHAFDCNFRIRVFDWTSYLLAGLCWRPFQARCGFHAIHDSHIDSHHSCPAGNPDVAGLTVTAIDRCRQSRNATI